MSENEYWNVVESEAVPVGSRWRPRDIIGSSRDVVVEEVRVSKRNPESVAVGVFHTWSRPTMSGPHARRSYSLERFLERFARLADGAIISDSERMDWMEANVMKVRRYVVGGKFALIAKDSGDALPGKPTLREAIDAALRATAERT